MIWDETKDVYVKRWRKYLLQQFPCCNAFLGSHDIQRRARTHRDGDVRGEDEHNYRVIARERHAVGRVDVRGGCGGLGTRGSQVVARSRLLLGRDDVLER